MDYGLTFPPTLRDGLSAYAVVRGSVLAALSERCHDTCYGPTEVAFGLRSLEIDTGLPREVVRAVMRDLVDSRLARYCRGGFNDDGEVAGSGYGITDAGIKAILGQAAPSEKEAASHA